MIFDGNQNMVANINAANTLPLISECEKRANPELVGNPQDLCSNVSDDFESRMTQPFHWVHPFFTNCQIGGSYDFDNNRKMIGEKMPSIRSCEAPNARKGTTLN